MSSLPKKVLFILPHHNFRDKEYTWMVEVFDAAGIEHEVASSHLSEAQGRFGTIVVPDVNVSFVSSGDYDGFIFVGEEAAAEFYGEPEVIKLALNAIATHKVVAAIGHAVPILGFTGQLNSRKVAAPPELKTMIEEAGAFYTGRLIEQDGDILTASGPYGVRELAESFIKALEWADGAKAGRNYLR